MMDRLLREGNPPTGQLASPVPQAWNPAINDFQQVTGQDLGGGRFGADGVQWGKTASGLFVPVRVTNDGVQEVQLSGAFVEVVDITDQVGSITAGASKLFYLPSQYHNKFLYASVYFRREFGGIEKIMMRHDVARTTTPLGAATTPMDYVGAIPQVNVTAKTPILTGRFTLVFQATAEDDFIPHAVVLHLWRA